MARGKDKDKDTTVELAPKATPAPADLAERRRSQLWRVWHDHNVDAHGHHMTTAQDPAADHAMRFPTCLWRP